jgi:hypothetical protein
MHQVRIRAYRATEDNISCRRFAEGHRKVLEIFGISRITSANLDWIMNSGVIVIQAESLDKNNVYGGVRIHLLNEFQPLPIVTAVGGFDPGVNTQVMESPHNKTAEICGFWNLKEHEAWGVDGIQLIRTALAVVKQMDLKSVLALCAPYTVKMALDLGFEVANTLGNMGNFYYPKDDLIATAMILRNPDTLSSAAPLEKESIFKLWQEPRQNSIIESKKGPVELIYDLDISAYKNLIH